MAIYNSPEKVGECDLYSQGISPVVNLCVYKQDEVHCVYPVSTQNSTSGGLIWSAACLEESTFNMV